MERNLSNEELIEIYNELYLNREDGEKSIDFETFVMNYKIYLSLFFNVDSSFYGDIEFLLFAVDGFNYLYKCFFDDEEVDLDVIPLSLCEHDSRLRRKRAILEEVNYTDSDAVLVYSLKLAMMFKDMNLVDDYYDEILKIFFNSYVVESKEKGCGKNGMENRKYCN